VIGPDSIIECETLRLGRLVAFGRRTRVHCRSLEIGDALWSKDDVVIGGGGSGEPGARLRAGDACFFGEGAYLNPCHPVTLGDEVCIGSRAMLFTHSHWQSVLRGYSAVFAPVEIGDGVFIGNNAFVFPGVSIGAGATVVVNSMVAHNVPPATLVAGVPAQVIRRIVPPTRDEQIEIAFRLMPELGEVLRQRGYAVSFGGEKRVERIEVVGKGGVWFVPRWTSEAVRGMEPRAVVLTFADDRVGQIREGLTVFDLAASQVIGEQDELSDEVREFCRRRGIRFRPYAWRYGVGHFEGERFQRRG
jgi:acetyltransferase-like isoleucine patch superfamily enzyme